MVPGSLANLRRVDAEAAITTLFDQPKSGFVLPIDVPPNHLVRGVLARVLRELPT